MEKNFNEINKLLKQIDIEQTKYQKAIKSDKPFAEVKTIYLRIKEYQKHLQVLMSKTDKELVELSAIASSYFLKAFGLKKILYFHNNSLANLV